MNYNIDILFVKKKFQNIKWVSNIQIYIISREVKARAQIELICPQPWATSSPCTYRISTNTSTKCGILSSKACTSSYNQYSLSLYKLHPRFFFFLKSLFRLHLSILLKNLYRLHPSIL